MTLSQLRDRLELLLSINTGDSYIDSQSELDDVNEGYRKTSYSWDWPHLLVKRGIRILANNKKYSLPSNVRKLDYVYVKGVKYREVSLDQVHRTPLSYAIDLSTNEIIISSLPGSSATQYTMSNAESAGDSVTIELDSTTGLSVGDEIYIDDATNPEVTYIQSIVSGTSITARLDTSKSSSTILYRGKDIIMISFYRTVTDLSATTDEPLLPSAIHSTMLNYSAFLAYARLEAFDEAARNLDMWREQMNDYFRAFDPPSTGPVSQFSV